MTNPQGIALLTQYMHAVGLRMPVRVNREEGYEYDEDPNHEGVPKGAYEIDECICLAPGKKERHAFGTTVFLDWWYVYTYTYRIIHNYPREPDDMATVPLADSQSFAEACKLAIIHALQHQWAQLDEIAYVAEIKEAADL